jgi:hypothetical protein
LIGKDTSSISREIARNSILISHEFNKNNEKKKSRENYHYLPNKAHKKYLERKREV